MKIIFLSLLVLLAGCHPSVETVAIEVKNLLQSKIDSDPGLKKSHLVVSDVSVIHEEGNRYGGIATLLLGGEPHTVSLKILADGSKVMYEASDGAFLFATQRQAGIEIGTAMCTSQIMLPAKAAYEERAKERNTGHDFPEADLQSSVEPMCRCIIERIGSPENAPLQQDKMEKYAKEAMSGGTCKPAGLLGEILKASGPPPP
jgi:hypothetical protein